jgi:hypothetical protein
MGLDLIPSKISRRFEFHERHHACAILARDFPDEFADLIGCLEQFKLVYGEIVSPAGSKTKIAGRFDKYFYARGWRAWSTAVEMMVDGERRGIETLSLGLSKARVACEVQWNSKAGVFSRALTTCRLLHEWNIISVGVVITQAVMLQDIVERLDKKRWQYEATAYGQATKHCSPLTDRIRDCGPGICPLLLVGIKKECYVDNRPHIGPRLTKVTE